MNILIIDNCESLRLFCTLILSRQGHDCLTADTTNFREIIYEHIDTLDVVMLNVNPVYPGIAQEFYNIKETLKPDLHIIIMSTPWDSPVIKKLEDNGCLFLPIPFKAKDLTELIQLIYIIRRGNRTRTVLTEFATIETC